MGDDFFTTEVKQIGQVGPLYVRPQSKIRTRNALAFSRDSHTHAKLAEVRAPTPAGSPLFKRECAPARCDRCLFRRYAANVCCCCCLVASGGARARRPPRTRQTHRRLLRLADLLVMRALEGLAVAQEAQVAAVVRRLAEAAESLLDPVERERRKSADAEGLWSDQGHKSREYSTERRSSSSKRAYA